MRRWRLLNWLAMIGLLCQVLVPVYAMAATTPHGARAILICTANGVMWVSLDNQGRPIAPIQPVEKPCHFCPSQATPFAAPGGIGLPIRADDRSAQDFRPAEYHPRVALVHGAQPARAPPATL
jgi:hypothetical protein